MGRLLIFAVLIVTIPRWAGAFLPIDKFVIFGIPVTAIGTGLVMGLGTFYVVETLQMVNREFREALSKWEAHDKAMDAQGKTNRKPKPEPPRSRWWLGAFFTVLLVLTTLSQTPYIISEFTGTPVNELIRIDALWVYSVILVVSPEIIIAAVALATHERGALKNDKGKAKEAKEDEVFSLRSLGYRLVSKIAGLREDVASDRVEEASEQTDEAKQLRCFCGWNGTTSRKGLSSHCRIHKEKALEFDTPTLAYKHFVEKYPGAYNGEGEECDLAAPNRETLERWFVDK